MSVNGLNLGLVKQKTIKVEWYQDGTNNEHPIYRFKWQGHIGEVVNQAGNGLWIAKLDNSGRMDFESEQAAKAAAEEWLDRKVAERYKEALQHLELYGEVIDCEHIHDKPVAELKMSKLAQWMKEEPSIEWLQDDFPIGTKFYTSPQPLIYQELRSALITAANELTHIDTKPEAIEALRVIQNVLGEQNNFVLRDELSGYMVRPIAYAVYATGDKGKKIIEAIKLLETGWQDDSCELGERWLGNVPLTIEGMLQALPGQIEAYEHLNESNRTQFYMQEEHVVGLVKNIISVINEQKHVEQNGGSIYALVKELREANNLVNVFERNGAIRLPVTTDGKDLGFSVSEHDFECFCDDLLTLSVIHGLNKSWMSSVNRAMVYIDSDIEFMPAHSKAALVSDLNKVLSGKSMLSKEETYKSELWAYLKKLVEHAKIEDNPFEFMCRQINAGYSGVNLTIGQR